MGDVIDEDEHEDDGSSTSELESEDLGDSDADSGGSDKYAAAKVVGIMK